MQCETLFNSELTVGNCCFIWKRLHPHYPIARRQNADSRRDLMCNLNIYITLSRECMIVPSDHLISLGQRLRNHPKFSDSLQSQPSGDLQLV